MSGYFPPHIRRGAAALGITPVEYKARLNAEAAPKPVAVSLHEPRNSAPARSTRRRAHRSSSERRRRTRRVRHADRRVRVNYANTGAGARANAMNELHPNVVNLNENKNARGPNYRIERRGRPVSNMPAYIHSRRARRLQQLVDARATYNGPMNASELNAKIAQLSQKNHLSEDDTLLMKNLMAQMAE